MKNLILVTAAVFALSTSSFADHHGEAPATPTADTAPAASPPAHVTPRAQRMKARKAHKKAKQAARKAKKSARRAAAASH